jgi:hypothetical protein
MLVAVIIFCLVWFLLKKIIKSIFFLKTETGSNRPVSVQFFRTKTGSNRFGSVFPVRFFRFQAYKTKTEPIGFFKILIGFFYGSVFLIILF